MKLIDDRVKLLIERMDAYPDEFTTDLSKWDNILSRGVRNLNFVERFLVHRKWKKIQREATLHRIVGVITEPGCSSRLTSIANMEQTREIIRNWAKV